MATNYSGNPIATQAPGPQPSIGGTPVVSIPSDGDAGNSASIAQAFKENTDWNAFNAQAAKNVSHGFFFRDDFMGDTLNPSLWLSTSSAPVFAPSTGDDGFGVIDYNCGSGVLKQLRTPAFGDLTGVHGAAFDFSSRHRVVSMGGTSSSISLGFFKNSDDSSLLTFKAKNGSTNYFVNVNGGSDHDTGVSFGGMHFLDISYDGTTYSFSIDGTVVYSEVTSVTAVPYLGWNSVGVTSGTTRGYLDYVATWHAR
jgi:hypothetical protein